MGIHSDTLLHRIGKTLARWSASASKIKHEAMKASRLSEIQKFALLFDKLEECIEELEAENQVLKRELSALRLQNRSKASRIGRRARLPMNEQEREALRALSIWQANKDFDITGGTGKTAHEIILDQWEKYQSI